MIDSRWALVALWGLAMILPTEQALGEETDAGKLRVYVGTYTGGESKGIYVSAIDLNSGAMDPARLAAESENPSFVAIHPNGRFLYAVNELVEFAGQKSGAVTAFAIQPDGSLQQINQQPSRGGAPCHLVVDRAGRNVLVANYVGGNVASLPIQKDGGLKPATGFVQHRGSSVNPQRQEGPHAHSINLDAANRFAFAADLGLDKILVYQFDGARGTLAPHDPPSVSVKAGAGPRHFDFHPSGNFAYVINEIDLTVTAFSYSPAAGVLKPIQTIPTLAKGVQGHGLSTAEVRVHPNGKFLYGSNRGHHTIVVYTIDPATGKLTYVEHQSTQGSTPRNFYVEPTGRYLMAENQSTGTVVVFRINPQTGELTPSGHQLAVPSPVCIRTLRLP